ncbi:MAG: DNA primase [Candidatus Phytoplasma sp.]|nr:DNA primase [Phytoplasma sp.]
MNDNIIQKINEETNIVDLVSEFVQLEKRGKNFMGLCPFHQENTPSFSVSPEKNIAVCMSCKEGGQPLTFYSKIKNIPFSQAIYELGERLGLKVEHQKAKKDPNEKYYQMMEEASLFYQFSLKNTKQGQNALTYLEKRNINQTLIEQFQIGWSPKEIDALYLLLRDKGYNVSDMIALGLVKQNDEGNYYDLFRSRLVFPITNPQGKVVGFSGRTLDKNEQVKYMNSPETPIFKKGEVLYHFHESQSEVRRQNKIILYEGFFDVLASYKSGLTHSVATMGTALTENQVKLIKNSVNEVIIAYDGDNAGKSSAIKASDLFLKNHMKVSILNIPNKLDPDDYVKKHGETSYNELFKTNVIDPYEFRYLNAIEHKDLKNALHINDLKRELQAVFRYADPNIKKLYENKITKELGLQIALTGRLVTNYPEPNDPFIVQKPIIDSIGINKYTWTELTLLGEVLQRPDYLRYILDKLNFHEMSDHRMIIIFEKIAETYQTYESDKIDLEHFMKTYPEYNDILNKVINHIDWKEKKVFKNLDEIDEAIHLINVVYKEEKELKDLLKQITEITDQADKHSMLKRITELQNSKQKKWGS